MDHSDILLLIKLHFLKQVFDEFLSHFWESCFFMFDIDQLDRVFDIKRNRDDIISIEIAIEDPGRNGVAIQTDQEIKEGSPVTDDDRFLMMFLREDLFWEVEGVVGSLVIAKVWEIFQIWQVDDLLLGQGIGLADKDMRLRCKEVGSNQVIIIQHLREDISVVAIQKEYANFASEILDVIDDLPSPRLP